MLGGDRREGGNGNALQPDGAIKTNHPTRTRPTALTNNNAHAHAHAHNAKQAPAARRGRRVPGLWRRRRLRRRPRVRGCADPQGPGAAPLPPRARQAGAGGARRDVME